MHNVSFSVPLEEKSLKRSELLSRSFAGITHVVCNSFVFPLKSHMALWALFAGPSLLKQVGAKLSEVQYVVNLKCTGNNSSLMVILIKTSPEQMGLKHLGLV